MLPSYKADLTPDNINSAPIPCMACKRAAGIVWRRGGLYCYDCDAASRPVVLDWPTISAALTIDQPVISAKRAVEALERCVGRA